MKTKILNQCTGTSILVTFDFKVALSISNCIFNKYTGEALGQVEKTEYEKEVLDYFSSCDKVISSRINK